MSPQKLWVSLLGCAAGITVLLLGSLYFGPSNPDADPMAHIVISEVMADNKAFLADTDGNYYAWVEIENQGSSAVDLSDLYLTDDAGRPCRYRLPDEALKSGECVVVYLTGNKQESRPFYAPFALGDKESTVYLFKENQTQVASLSVTEREDDLSFGLFGGKTGWFLSPTPGKPNGGIHAPNLSALREAAFTGVQINEVCAVSRKSDEDYPCDWIELYNTTDKAVDLSGYRLTDGIKKAGYTLPATKLGPQEYLLIYCDSDEEFPEGETGAPFSIDAYGETIYLFTADGVMCDSFATGKQRWGITSGRCGKDRLARYFFDKPTPCAANKDGYTGYAPAPIINTAGGYSGGSVSVDIAVPASSAVYYSTDGSRPSSSSYLYNGTPIHLPDSAVLRAVTYKDGFLPSDIVTETYLTEGSHDIPVLSVSGDPTELFGYRGVFTRYTDESLESVVHAEYFTAAGEKTVEFDSRLKLSGGYTRQNVQKAFSLNLGQSTGQSSVSYPFFKDTNVTSFSSLLLRPSGSDWSSAKLRDEFTARALKNTDDQIIQSAQPVALYINGHYKGLYYLREKRNEDFISAYTNIPAAHVQLAKQPALDDYKAELDPDLAELIEYAEKHDMTDETAYQYVLSQIDKASLMRYIAIESFFGNGDMINNIACYRDDRGGKWKWIVFDMDWACTAYYENRNFLSELKKGRPYAVYQHFYYPLMTALLNNQSFRDEFLSLYLSMMDTTLSADRLTGILDQLANEIETEIPRQYQKYHAPSVNTWNKQIDYIREFLQERKEAVQKQIKEAFSLSEEEWETLCQRAAVTP